MGLALDAHRRHTEVASLPPVRAKGRIVAWAGRARIPGVGSALREVTGLGRRRLRAERKPEPPGADLDLVAVLQH